MTILCCSTKYYLILQFSGISQQFTILTFILLSGNLTYHRHFCGGSILYFKVNATVTWWHFSLFFCLKQTALQLQTENKEVLLSMKVFVIVLEGNASNQNALCFKLSEFSIFFIFSSSASLTSTEKWVCFKFINRLASQCIVFIMIKILLEDMLIVLYLCHIMIRKQEHKLEVKHWPWRWFVFLT